MRCLSKLENKTVHHVFGLKIAIGVLLNACGEERLVAIERPEPTMPWHRNPHLLRQNHLPNHHHRLHHRRQKNQKKMNGAS